MKVKILRRRSPVSAPYWQSFLYDGPADNSVAGMLDWINYRDDVTDAEGNPAPRISWECSCLQGMCGACAMVINGVPALACETFLRDLKGEELTLEPLSKFPVIADLVVDRAVIQQNLTAAGAFIEQYVPSAPEEYPQQYAAAKCLKCGLCLEVCPNYRAGERFYGAAFANDCYLVATRSPKRDPALKRQYRRHFADGCSKSLSCMDVCPMKISTLASMAKLNRGK